jgi:hypothetical protein
LNTSRAIKKGGGENLKTDYAVFVHYQVEQTYKKIRMIGQREEMSCLISFGMSKLGFFRKTTLI